MKKLYSIYDKTACEYGPIFEAKNDEIAKRMCSQIVMSNKTLPILDLELFALATFDNENGEVSSSRKFIVSLFKLVTTEVENDTHESK